MFLFVYIIYLMYICKLIKSKFMDYKNYIQYHDTKAIDKDGLIGVCLLWGYKNVFKFGNEKCEKVGFIEYPLTAFETGDLIQITSDKFHEEYKKRNVYSDETERTRSYGIIHDSILAVAFERTKQYYWSKDFCVAFASNYANMLVFEDCKKKFNSTDQKYLLSNFNYEYREIYLKHHLNDPCAYMDKIEELMEDNLTLDDVYLQIEEFKKLPLEWRTQIESELDDFLK